MVERGRSPLVSIRPTEIKLRVLASSQVVIAFIVIAVGTLVTGSGPHAGDWQAPRLHLDHRAITWLHADAVIALLGISLALFVLSDISPETKKRLKYFFAATLAQGLIGYIQYAQGLPELIVMAHLLGSTLVWISVWRVWLSITTAERK
jgi:cytochrome c oxidase assembly protein subunit 15